MVNGAILLFAYGLMCWLVGRRLPLITVHYVFAEEPFSSELEPFYRAPMLFEQPRTEIRFDAELLDLPIMPDEERLRRFLASMPNALLVRYRDDSSMAERVRGILRRNLKRPLSFEDIAGMLAVSPQTLRRRLLEEESCGFQEIKDSCGAIWPFICCRSPGCRSKKSGSPWVSRNPAPSTGRSDGGPAWPQASSATAVASAGKMSASDFVNSIGISGHSMTRRLNG